MPVLVSLMWGANHTVPETGQGFLGIANSQLAALWSLDKKNQLAAGYRTTEMTGTEGIIRKCSRTRLVWSSGERGKPPKKRLGGRRGKAFYKSGKNTPPLLRASAIDCCALLLGRAETKEISFLKCECTYFLTNQAEHLAANIFCSFSLAN